MDEGILNDDLITFSRVFVLPWVSNLGLINHVVWYSGVCMDHELSQQQQGPTTAEQQQQCRQHRTQRPLLGDY